jgi:hypothetical protein
MMYTVKGLKARSHCTFDRIPIVYRPKMRCSVHDRASFGVIGERSVFTRSTLGVIVLRSSAAALVSGEILNCSKFAADKTV